MTHVRAVLHPGAPRLGPRISRARVNVWRFDAHHMFAHMVLARWQTFQPFPTWPHAIRLAVAGDQIGEGRSLHL